MNLFLPGSPSTRRIAAGILTWLIPFLAAIPFYGRDGVLLIDQMFFKSAMIVIASVTAACLMVWHFSRVPAPYTREAVVTSLVWLGINWILDLVVLVALLGMPVSEYVTAIGLRYLMIPAMVIACGIIADRARERTPAG